MSVIAPGTTIYLLKDVPLDDTFDHTLYWENTAQGKADQLDWFIGQTNGFVERKLENYTYQRIEKGSCMVEAVADDIYGCNYMVFQNSPQYGSKWWFCFIQNVEYVNNKTSRLTLKIDIMQTFYFDYEILPCFVEREHPVTDIFGHNIQEEQVEFGPYEHEEVLDYEAGDNYIVVCGNVRPKEGVTGKWTKEDIEDYGGGGQYSGVYSGTIYNVFKYPVSVNEFLNAVTAAGKELAIVNVFMAPAKFFAEEPIDADRIDENDSPYSREGGAFVGGLRGSGGFSSGCLPDVPAQEDITGVPKPTHVGGYFPRNYKLLCWPYCFLTVDNNNGASADYRYELFSEAFNYCLFKAVFALSANPEACVYPRYYKDVTDNYMEKLVIDDFPQCSYAIDSYKAWLAQHRYTMITSATLDAVNLAGAVATGGLAGGLVGLGAFNSVFQKMGQIKQASTLPPHAKGQQTNTMMTALHRQGFHFYKTHITRWYAELVDQYFSRFGYVCNRIRVPNRSSRKHFTYCKTRNCDIASEGVPNKYVRQIKEVYDNGIAFWKDTDKNNVGRYTVAIFDDNQAPHYPPKNNP